MPDNSVDYGTAKEPNLERISRVLSETIRKYNFFLSGETRCSASIQGDPVLQLTPEKPNTARVVLDFMYGMKKAGDLYVLLFAPGDGTGKAGDYSLEQFRKIPSEYRFKSKPDKVLPRNKLKEGVLTEAFFPLFSVEGSQHFPYLVSLEQITVDNNTNPKKLQKGLSIGFNASLFQSAFLDPTTIFKPENPSMELTCGYYRNGQRFGDPHATFYNPKLAEGHPNLMQVAGFLAVESADNPLCKVLDKIGIVPK